MTDLYFEVSALLGDECQCGGDFLKCSTEDGGCCSEEAIGDMTGYCGGDTMRKLYEKLKYSESDDDVGSEAWNRANGIEPPHDSPSLQDDSYYGTMMDIQQYELGGGR